MLSKACCGGVFIALHARTGSGHLTTSTGRMPIDHADFAVARMCKHNRVIEREFHGLSLIRETLG